MGACGSLVRKAGVIQLGLRIWGLGYRALGLGFMFVFFDGLGFMEPVQGDEVVVSGPCGLKNRVSELDGSYVQSPSRVQVQGLGYFSL